MCSLPPAKEAGETFVDLADSVLGQGVTAMEAFAIDSLELMEDSLDTAITTAETTMDTAASEAGCVE